MSLRELAELREDAAGLARDEAEARFARVAGLAEPTTAAARAKAHRLASSRDGLAQACELLADSEEDSALAGRAARLSSLRDFLVGALAHALDPGAAQELRDLARRPAVRPPGDAGLHGALPPVAVDRELPFLRERQRRGELERALAAALEQEGSVRSSAWEAAQAALEELRLGSPLEAAAALHARGWRAPRAAQEASPKEEGSAAAAPGGTGASAVRSQFAPPTPTELAKAAARALPPELQARAGPPPVAEVEAAPETAVSLIRAAAERVLRGTEALANDLYAWLLERHTGARPFPGGAERHDALHLIHAPRCASAFPRGELLRTCRRWAEMLRIDLDAGGLIRLDEDERPLRRAGAHAVALDPPHEVRISLAPAEGPRALAELLSALGAAQLRAGPPEDAPPEDLWFGDAALPHACGALFASLAREPAFLRRCAKADLARDDERTIAVAFVLDARLAAARTLGALEAHEAGLGRRSEQAYRELFARATLTELPAGLAPRELDPFLGSWAALRGLALASRLRVQLRERFDEDFWRNPRAGAALQGLWARGGRPTLRELWSELAGRGDEALAQASVEPLLADLAEACR